LPGRAARFVELTTAAGASAVAVQDGRILKLGLSRQLGRFVVLQDVYGDRFTYAALGSIAPSYHRFRPRPTLPSASAAALRATATLASRPFTLTLERNTARVRGPARMAPQRPPAPRSKVRLYAHPGNADALVASALGARPDIAGPILALRPGALVAAGTVLGHVDVRPGSATGHLRFAIRPAGDPATIDPRAVLSSWVSLHAALHPSGATKPDALLGATAGDVLVLSRADLQRSVLADPGVSLDACSRRALASAGVVKPVLAALAYLSRSDLKPTARVPGCGVGAPVPTAAQALDLTAINGVPIAGNQGSGSIADETIRTLLALPAGLQPRALWSLMRYPGAPRTHAALTYDDRIRLVFAARPAPRAAISPAAIEAATAPAQAARAAMAAEASPTYAMSSGQWEQLMTTAEAIPTPKVSTRPSSAAVADPPHG
jgi:hypothetical protein